MHDPKIYIVMVGLPARGKSTLARKLQENLVKDGIATRIFNNGNLRRQLVHVDSSVADFYNPDNKLGNATREHIADINIERARRFLANKGQVAILDATNVTQGRRQRIQDCLNDHPILFLECLNDDAEILEASILRKASLSEFNHLNKLDAVQSFKTRIQFYETMYTPLSTERNFVQLDSLNNKVLREEISDSLPYYDRVRDFIVTDSVKNLFLIRHGETYFNLENRVGGDSLLTGRGRGQAELLAQYFRRKRIPVIFTSHMQRTIETAEPIQDLQSDCTIIPLAEFNEIFSGECEGMSYEEIRSQRPDVYFARKAEKYNYSYPGGEGYATMRHRINRGIKKALYLSSNSNNIMIVGHQAVNRMILSHFLFRRTEDVPYIYIPQDKFYHIVSVQNKKMFRLIRY